MTALIANAEDIAIERVFSRELRVTLNLVLAVLGTEEREVILRRSNGETLSEIAHAKKVATDKVQRIYSHGLRTLQTGLPSNLQKRLRSFK